MACTEVIGLITKSREAAYEALRELKRLNHEGWIDMTCHVLLDADARSGLRVRETSERAETIRLAAPGGLTGALIGCFFGPGGALLPSAADAAVDSNAAEAGLDHNPDAVHGELQPGCSALLVMVEPRYAERVVEEFESRGLTLRRQMQGNQCELALRASIEEVKSKIAWLEELLEHESDKAGWTSGAEKEKLESAIRAGRAELAAEQEHLQARLMALRAELETRMLEITRGAEKEGAGAAIALSRDIADVERDITDINEDLALCILDHLDGLATRASELREKATQASVDAAAAFEDQEHELEVQMRKYRADLTATLASSASLARHCEDRIRSNPRMENSGVESTLQDHVHKLQQRYALLKADIQHVQREDSRTWRDLAAGFRQAWRGLRESLNQAVREAG
jgi:uncharacterized membrane protein